MSLRRSLLSLLLLFVLSFSFFLAYIETITFQFFRVNLILLPSSVISVPTARQVKASFTRLRALIELQKNPFKYVIKCSNTYVANTALNLNWSTGFLWQSRQSSLKKVNSCILLNYFFVRSSWSSSFLLIAYPRRPPVTRKARDLEDLTGKWGSVNSLLQSLIFMGGSGQLDV